MSTYTARGKIIGIYIIVLKTPEESLNSFKWYAKMGEVLYLDMITWPHSHCGWLASECRPTQCPWSTKKQNKFIGLSTRKGSLHWCFDVHVTGLTCTNAMTRAATAIHRKFCFRNLSKMGWHPCVKQTQNQNLSAYSTSHKSCPINNFY